MKKEIQERKCISHLPTKMPSSILKKRTRGCFFSIALIFGVATALIANVVITIAGVDAIFNWEKSKFTYHDAINLMLSYECFYFIPFEPYELTSIELIEEDSYGRRLYCYSCLGGGYTQRALLDHYGVKPWSGTSSDIYFIMQMKGKKEVCYYAGKSLYFSTDPLEETAGVDQLKKINDWGKPLDLKKVTKITYDPSRRNYPPYIDSEVTQKALCKYLDQEWDNAYIGAIYDEKQRPVYIAREVVENSEDGAEAFKNTYAFMLNEQKEVEVCVVIEGDLNTWIKQMENLRRN